MAREGRDKLIDIACTITGETGKAFRIDHGGEDDVWVPKSLCEWSTEDGTMTMPEWLAMDKGLI
jgi:hypothetical protein